MYIRQLHRGPVACTARLDEPLTDESCTGVWLLVRITCAAPLGTAPLTTFGGFGHRSGIVLSHAGAQLVWDYFKENLDQIKDMLKAASPSLMGAVVVNVISAFSTLERAQEIEDFFKV